MNTRNTPIDFRSSTPLFKQVKSLILTQISRGELKPHDPILSERAYENKFGISRQTIRRALEELRLTGVLYRIPGKGTYVAEPPPTTLPIRVIGSTSFLVDTGDHTINTVTLESNPCPTFAADLLKLQEGARVIFVEQIELTPNEPRLIHRAYIPMDVGRPILEHQHTNLSVINLLINVCGQRPSRSRDRLYFGLANDHDARLLDIGPDDNTQMLRGVITASDGKPLEAHEVVIRTDHFKLDFEFDIELLREMRLSEKQEE
jgi:GntR family transcriptional regulator